MIRLVHNSHDVVVLRVISVPTLGGKHANVKPVVHNSHKVGSVVSDLHRSSQSCLFKSHAVVCDTSMLLFSGILHNLDSIRIMIYLLKSYFARLRLQELVVLGCISITL